MNDNTRQLETVVGALLANEPRPTPERIRSLIENARQLEICQVDDEASEKLARIFEARHEVTMTLGVTLVDQEYEPWLDDARAKIDPYYWERYRRLLAQKNFSGHVISTIDTVTDRTLGYLEDPSKDGPWDRRGMVVGHVQSGKTANYIGLICKAADAGYKLIVVIAGIHNNLRNQTQFRIDEGFVGRDSARLLSNKGDRFIGVGRFDKTRRPSTFTSSIRDFSKNRAEGLGIPLQNLIEPAVFVIKKNPSTLKNLLEWLEKHSARSGGTVDAPMLLIDDEADNASINIAHGKDSVARINGQIRSLLRMFERSCYIGYTATPFANIFIDPETDDQMFGNDLFPRSFIVSLDPPSNYFGPVRVFLDDQETVLRDIHDNEEVLPLKHKIDFNVTALPPSLRNAIRAFVVARAIRLARMHHSPHCSMLVNASRFTRVQAQLRNEIHQAVGAIRSSVRVHGGLPEREAVKDPEIAALQSVWDSEYRETGVAWGEVLAFLHESVAPIKVVEVNSQSSGTLDYIGNEKSGLNVIAVGGFSLSRGLTLEGLMISYFLRNSMMYDTLMQMGRWFGYRPGYDDVCRVWMPEEAVGWYAHIAESIELLRDELRDMEVANATPEEFGLKVRSHPDALIVTARNKMGSGEKVVVNIGLGNNFIETAILRREEDCLDRNRRSARRFAEALESVGCSPSEAELVSGGWLIGQVPAQPIIEFLRVFENHPGSVLTDPRPVIRYIEERMLDELSNWDVLLAGLEKAPATDALSDDSLGLQVHCQRRSAGSRSDQSTIRVTGKQRVASRGIEQVGLLPEQITQVKQEYEETHRSKLQPGNTLNYPDRIYRGVRERPLFILHLLKIIPEDERYVHSEPVVAWSISFPRTKLEEKRVEYVVNTTWLHENCGDDLNEEEIRGEGN